MIGLRTLTRNRLQDYPDPVDEKASKTLGLVSLAIGLTEITAARKLDRFMGTGQGQNATIFRLLGAREICHGIHCLASKDDPAPALWGRVAGDVLDTAMLGVAAAKTRRFRGVAAIFALVLPVVIADMLLAPRMSKHKRDADSSWF